MALALPAWLRQPSDRTKDIALALLLAVPVVGTGVDEGIRHGKWWVLVPAVAAIVPMLWQRRYPVAAFAAIVVAASFTRDDTALLLPAMVALYWVALLRPNTTIAACVGGFLGAVVLHRTGWSQTIDVGDVLGPAVVCGIAATFGLAAKARLASLGALRERAERLDRERELLAEQAVFDERVRIARELHDVVAHSVSLMVVQAQALGATAREAPVKEATDGIAHLGREVMTEMHRTLKLLRDEDEGDPARAPRPGLANLDRLVEQSRAGGLEVDLAIEGTPRALSQSLDLSAFRIVQEALTNTRKHAPGAAARVTVGYGVEALDLRVRNGAGGVPSRGASNGSGNGMLGMRERAALFGGTFEATALGDGGFDVHAVLPYATEVVR